MVLRGLILAALFAAAPGNPAATSTSGGSEIPGALAPFEYLVGSWKGTGVPTANRIKGWPERHAWAWKFEKGVPVGLALAVTGGRLLTGGLLTPVADGRGYVLTGTGPDGKSLAFRGSLDKAGKTLTLDRVGPAPDGALQRLTVFPNANLVRYSVWVSERETGAPQYKRTVESGLTKEGESFASGGAAADSPKCIVTGGAATLSVTYQGASYPLCCTGCRDEFNENPAKYLKKLALRSASAGAKAPAGNLSSPAGKDDGAFAGLGDEPAAKPTPRDTPEEVTPPAGAATAPEPSKKKPAAKAAPADPVARAAALLKLGQNLEKTGKTDAALVYYRRVVKDFPGTPAAKTAGARVKALTPAN